MTDRKSAILSLLRPGDVLNSDFRPPWWNIWLKLVCDQIREYQDRKYPKSARANDTHSMLFLGGDEFLSVTVPRAKIIHFKPEKRTTYRICRYDPFPHSAGEKEGAKSFPPPSFPPLCGRKRKGGYYSFLHSVGEKERGDFSDIPILRAAAQSLVGTKYDLPQLLSIMAKQLFPIIKDDAILFGESKKETVCSGGVHFCLLAWYYQIGKALGYPRPLGDQYFEITCPADFANHQTFTVIAENL